MGAGKVKTGLSPRQTEVMLYLARGYHISEVAKIMDLAESTVANHTEAIRTWYGVNSTTQAIIKFLGLPFRDEKGFP